MPEHRPRVPVRWTKSTDLEDVYRNCTNGDLLCHVWIVYSLPEMTVLRRMKHGSPVICPAGFDPSKDRVDCWSKSKHVNCTIRSDHCAIQRLSGCGISYDIVSKGERFPRCPTVESTNQSRVNCGPENIIKASSHDEGLSSCCNLTTVYMNRDHTVTRCDPIRLGQTPECHPGYDQLDLRCTGSDNCGRYGRADIDHHHCSQLGLQLKLTCKLDDHNCPL